MSLTMILVGVVAVLIVIVLLIPVFQCSTILDLTAPSNTKPEWTRDMPPAETVNASMEDGKGIPLFDHDEGEKLAAPFAKQIEDIVRAKVKADPELKDLSIDFGTGENHKLEIWVNEKKYNDIAELPSGRLKQGMREAVQQYGQVKPTRSRKFRQAGWLSTGVKKPFKHEGTQRQQRKTPEILTVSSPLSSGGPLCLGTFPFITGEPLIVCEGK